MSLYLKYRPQDFANLVGQEHIRQTLLGALKNGNLAHAYLFCGPRGTGKTSTARLIAKAINCQDPKEDHEPCNRCAMCLAADHGNLVDLIEIDAASNRSIDDIRDLREKVRFSPTQAKNKVYIIDEVHMLTKEAFNALLKTLEEPPANVFFILATTESHKVPETIISRCQRFNFQRLSLGSVIDRLKYIAETEGIFAEEEALQLIAQASEGGMRDAIGLLDQFRGEGAITVAYVREHLGLIGEVAVREFFSALLEKKPLPALSLLRTIVTEGQSLSQFGKELLEVARKEMLKRVEENLDPTPVMTIIDAFVQAQKGLRDAIILSLPFEVAIIESCGLIAAPSVAVIPQSSVDPTEEKKKTSFFSFGGSEEKKEEEKQVSELKTEEVSIEKTSENPSAATIAEELTTEGLKRKWGMIANEIPTSLIRIAFKNATPSDVIENRIVMSFTTDAYRRKVDENPGRAEVWRAFEKVMGQKVEFEAKLSEIPLSPLSTSEQKIDTPSSLSAMASEIFGE